MSATEKDYLQRFIFEKLGVRGEFVRLDESWKTAQEGHAYPKSMQTILGNALASVLLLSGTIKFKGSLIMQLQGKSAVHSLVTQATQKREIRGMVSFDQEADLDQDFSQLVEDSRLVLTAESATGERYQGIVAAEGKDFAAVVEGYFSQSEQLPSKIWLGSNADVSAGLFLQRLPATEGQDQDSDDEWQRICLLAETIKDEELTGLGAEEILYRLFNADDIRVFEPEPVVFQCSCSRERIAKALVGMGEGEIAQMLDEMEAIEVDCEFCNAHYRFDSIDAAALFSEDAAQSSDSIQ